MSNITLNIDGRQVQAEREDTVLKAARRAGIEIPTLCAHDELEPYGACRLCIVEIEGGRGYPTSCTTPVAEGMVVQTKTPEIVELRKNILKLLLSGHTSPCLVCLHKELCEKYRPHPTKSGKATRCAFCSNRDDCELRKLVEEYQIDDLELPIIYKNMDLERNDPFMDRDYNLCILCGRCVRICRKIHGKAAIDFIHRGKDARIGTAFHRDHIGTECHFCGACIDICPTGALSDRFSKWYGKPDKIEETTCVLCPEGCSLKLKIKDGKVVGAESVALTKEARICAVGRFILPQLFENSTRLTAHAIGISDGLRKASYEEAVAHAAEKLAGFSGTQFALIAHPAASREDLYIMEKFSKEVMQSDGFLRATPEHQKLDINPAAKALFTTGAYMDTGLLEKLDVTIVADVFPSNTNESADVLFAAALPVERDGTWLSVSGKISQLTVAVEPPDNVYPDWKIICNIAKKMGASGFDFDSADNIAKELDSSGAIQQSPAKPDPFPLDDILALPRFYRGHQLTDIFCALRTILDKADQQPTETAVMSDEKPFKIVSKTELVPNTHMVTIYAPAIARKCRPGQFIIGMANEKSERIPYTIADWNSEDGTVTINILEAGRSSREMVLLHEGDHLAHFVGPLGVPVEIKQYGTVVCGGGCYGVGSMLPIARALKKAGNKVICIEEASSEYLIYWQDKLSAHCDEFIIVTKDGSIGIKGGVQEAISKLVERGEKIDQAFIIGCTFMMMLVSEATKELSIPTLTALNPIMVDGTGMCGACRVTVGGSTKFTCVDGPFLDGHLIDWIELMQRRSAYGRLEIQALPQYHHGHEHKCVK